MGTIQGGNGSGDDLTLKSTAHATKGNIFFGTSTYDEANNRLGINTTSPTVALDVNGALQATGNVTFDQTLTVSGNTIELGRHSIVVDELTTDFTTNGPATTYINFNGYLKSNTQFRSLNICNGKRGIIATFDGPNGALNIASGKTLQINASDILDQSDSINRFIGVRKLQYQTNSLYTWTTATTENTVFDAISALIPNDNFYYAATGYMKVAADDIQPIYAIRQSSASVIRLYYGDNASLFLDDGDATAMPYNGGINF
jgi:hypothetical protein